MTWYLHSYQHFCSLLSRKVIITILTMLFQALQDEHIAVAHDNMDTVVVVNSEAVIETQPFIGVTEEQTETPGMNE